MPADRTYARRISVPESARPPFFANIDSEIAFEPDMVRVFRIGFSMYERAGTLRGIENLLMDFYINPQFVHELLDAICEYNQAQIDKALEYDIDAVISEMTGGSRWA